MKVYEVLNFFDRTRYFACANDEKELEEMLDKEFISKLEQYGDDIDKEERDYYLADRENRLEDYSYKLLIDDVSTPQLKEHNMSPDITDFYFYD